MKANQMCKGLREDQSGYTKMVGGLVALSHKRETVWRALTSHNHRCDDLLAGERQYRTI